MFIAALFTIAKTWKQPRCPSTDDWIKKLWYIYKMEYYSAIKRNAFESVLVRQTNLDRHGKQIVDTGQGRKGWDEWRGWPGNIHYHI